jgi:hypothetical protein
MPGQEGEKSGLEQERTEDAEHNASVILKTALGINRKEHKDRKEWNL